MSDRELNEDGTYTVRAGDSLSAIAEDLLGDAAAWSALYEANRDTIGANPNLIRPDQVLVLPVIDQAAPAEDAPAADAPAEG
jgi:nucleoid-associated protein YgaU